MHFQENKGFTLIEVLVVMLVLVTIGSIILSIFIIALTGASKSRNQQLVRENGNFAIAQITRQVQFAKGLNFVQLDYGETQQPNCVGNPENVTAVSINSFDGGETVFACTEITVDGASVTTIASTSASLAPTENDSLVNIKKIKVLDCHFTCRQNSPSDTPTIGVSLLLSPVTNTKNPVLFDTSIVPRNF